LELSAKIGYLVPCKIITGKQIMLLEFNNVRKLELENKTKLDKANNRQLNN